MRSEVFIRPAGPGDNDQLVRIARELALPARVRLGIDRAPDFAAFNRVAAESFEILVAELEGRVTGFIETRYLRMLAAGEPVLGAYFALVGVALDRRGLGVYVRLVAEAERRARASDAAVGVGLVNDRNPRMARVFGRQRAGAMLGRHVAVNSLVIGPGYRASREFRYVAPRSGELTEVAELVRRCHGEYLISTDIGPEALSRVGPECLLVAKDRFGRVRAVLGTWDQRRWRRIVVRGYGRADAHLRRFINLTRGITGVAPLPAVGGELKLLHAVFAAAEPGYERAFAGLLRHACGSLRGRGFHLLLIGLPDGDRLAGCLKGMLKIPGGNIPLVFARDELRGRLVQHGPPAVRFEYALA